MGYTHYWRKPGGLDKNKFKFFAEDVKQIIDTYNGADLEYVLEDDYVEINGVGEDSHETFIVTPEESGFDFCKTAQKPYDDVVTACLIALEARFGDAVKVTSDGGDLDWRAGRILAEKALGFGLVSTIDEESSELTW